MNSLKMLALFTVMLLSILILSSCGVDSNIKESDKPLEEVTQTQADDAENAITPPASDEPEELEPVEAAATDNSDESGYMINYDVLSDLDLSYNEVVAKRGICIEDPYYAGGKGYAFESGYGLYFFGDNGDEAPDETEMCHTIIGVPADVLLEDFSEDATIDELLEKYGLVFEETFYSLIDDDFVSIFSHDDFTLSTNSTENGTVSPQTVFTITIHNSVS